MPRISKVYSISDNEFKELIQKSTSYSDVLRALGLGTRGGSSTDTLKRRIQELQCSTDHFDRGASHGVYTTYNLQDILIEHSPYQSIARLKTRLVKENLLEYKCAICGINEWQGKPLSLQLDHINGIHDDHRLANLRFLCPNCHSQTETYAGKNKASGE